MRVWFFLLWLILEILFLVSVGCWGVDWFWCVFLLVWVGLWLFLEMMVCLFLGEVGLLEFEFNMSLWYLSGC